METEAAPGHEILPSRFLPQAPAADRNPLLFIDIANLTDSEVAQTVSNLQECVKDNDGNEAAALVQLWRPSNSAFLQPLRDKHQDMLKRYYKDSKTNLYGLAVIAHRSGYNFFFVADDYFRRGLRDESNPGFIPTSHGHRGIMVDIRSRTSADSAPENDEIHVFAVRETISDGRHRNILKRVRHGVTLLDVLGRDWMNRFEQFFNWGVELHDPTKSVFLPNTASLTGREEFEEAARSALAESTPLPRELVSQVINCLYDGDEPPFVMTTKFCTGDLNIFLLFPATKDECQLMQSSIQREVDKCFNELKAAEEEKGQRNEEDELETDKDTEENESDKCGGDDDDDEEGEDEDSDLYMSSDSDDGGAHEHSMRFPEKLTVRLIPWKYSWTASRLDLQRYWKLIHERYVCPVNFLLEPLPESEPQPQASPFGSVYHGAGGFMFISRNTIARMVRHVLTRPSETFRAVELRKEMKRNRDAQTSPAITEILYEPEQPLYYVSAPWEIPREVGMGSLAVFLLTNRITDEDIVIFINEMEEMGVLEEEYNDYDKYCHTIPWREDEEDAPDGTMDDIWKMFCELHAAGHCPPYFFADQQSIEELNVIMVDADTCSWEDSHEHASKLLQQVVNSDLKGLRYGRLGCCEAMTAWERIKRGNMEFVDFFDGEEDKILFYSRPDLQGLLET
ncbi:uncharacterized protein DSM5745_04617 [Aspergillus mulundensis]|uniref:Uncharacterized protein n=1 Tax=Aspergillus mulundensis TaxID=1810919 RepID=A0A3D8S4E8_9EURO|nr:hypothetical protein DSM5745_04617 [Aspergillus mulundensis]RDW81060.1 hypothetical protein DSM5745_04617 [Aspergillus mulundensis]